MAYAFHMHILESQEPSQSFLRLTITLKFHQHNRGSGRSVPLQTGKAASSSFKSPLVGTRRLHCHLSASDCPNLALLRKATCNQKAPLWPPELGICEAQIISCKSRGGLLTLAGTSERRKSIDCNKGSKECDHDHSEEFVSTPAMFTEQGIELDASGATMSMELL